jgi:glycosyltransferase involved in cell wall biosynthesis
MYALQAARQLQGQPVSFTFVGSPRVDLSAINWPSNVDVRPHVSRCALRSFYNTHHILLFPTLSDGFGLVQLEALAAGMPIVATDCCGDVIKENECGLRIEARSCQSITSCVKRFLDQPQLVEMMSSRCAERLRDYSEDHVWPAYDRLFAGNVRSEMVRNAGNAELGNRC